MVGKGASIGQKQLKDYLDHLEKNNKTLKERVRECQKEINDFHTKVCTWLCDEPKLSKRICCSLVLFA